jgi:photosystem II stability/assembly factor-like uncharacterized protein
MRGIALRSSVRTVLLVSIVLLVALVAVAVPGVASAADRWTKQTLPTDETWFGISSPDTTHAWAVGLFGDIIGTADGGQTWVVQYSQWPALWQIDCPDATHGWAVGLDCVVTTADGASWSAQSPPPGAWQGLDMVSDSTGWIVGEGGIAAFTADGGSTWTAQTSGTTESLWDVCALSGTEAWAVGNKGVLLHTTNAGTTWTSAVVDASKDLLGVAFSDARHGWLSSTDGVIFVTSDGGATWTAQASGQTAALWRAAPFTSGRVWMVGVPGVLLTDDSGTTWTKQAVGSDAAMWDCSFPYSGLGWVCGDGVILRYEEQHTITVTSGANGSVSPGTTQVWGGSDQTFTFTPGSGCVVADVVVDGASVGAPDPYTFKDVVADHTLSVTFTLGRYTIAVSSGAHGSVTPGTSQVWGLSDQTFTFTPRSGYVVADVVVDGASVGAPDQYTFKSIVTGHTLAVTFKPGPDNVPSCVLTGMVKGWSRRPVKLRITAHGAYGVPVDFISTAVDGRVLSPVHASRTTLDLTAQGVTRVKCFAVDENGSSSPTYQARVRIDSRAPRVVSRAVRVAGGSVARLPYKVADHKPGCGHGLVRLVVVDAAGRALTRASTRQAPVGRWRTVRVQVGGLAPGTYTVVWRAMDLAGNFQHGVTRTLLTVM